MSMFATSVRRVRGSSNLRTLVAIAFWIVIGGGALWYFEPWQGPGPSGPGLAVPQVVQAAVTAPSAPATAPPAGAVAAGEPSAAEIEVDGRRGMPAGVDMSVIKPDTRLDRLKVALARIDAGGKPEVLEETARVATGDRLRIAIDAPEPVHAYAFNQEEGGAISVMFPVDGVDRGNPLPAGQSELPGTANGQSLSYTVASRAPREEVLLVVSLVPVPELEAKRTSLAAVARGTAAPDPGDAELGALANLAGGLARSPVATELLAFRWVLEHPSP
jgi:hypothetical protein